MILPVQLNPAVTQATIQQTVCVPGYSTAYRAKTLPPAKAYSIKHRMLLQRGIHSTSGWILDHWISIEIGGTSDPANLRLQTTKDSDRKNKLEDSLHAAVCRGRIALHDAQLRLDAWK